MKNKKTVALAMAAMSVAGTVVPTFAAEADAVQAKVTVDVKLSEGKKVEKRKYDGVYDTKFTTDKKDDTLKDGVEVLQVIEKAKENNDGLYLVAVNMTEEELKEAKQKIAEEKLKLAQTEQEIKQNLGLKYIDKDGKEQKLYTFSKVEEEATDLEDSKNNALVVTLKSNKEGVKDITYRFEGIVIAEKELSQDATKVELDLTKKSGYEKLSRIGFDLEKAGNKYTVSQKEVNSTTLEVNVYTNDAKKAHVAVITINNVNKFNPEKFIRIPGNSDFAGHWAEKTIFDSMYAGIVDITNNFRTNDSITRAEFVKIVNKTFGYTTKADKEYFADVEQGQWFYDDILIALKEGYVNGYEDGTFKPNEKISRQEAAVIIAKVVNGGKSVETTFEDQNGNKVETDIKTDYKDDKDIAVWADESVKLLKDKNIIKGYEDKTFRPKNNITRAEALTMIKGAK